ncbi:5-formyltetrahydrofolate cyclo-ligase [Marinoscillum sp.]|uniref:5-formyltetrahydrofolate cyclo-ligase n=1 Tax=Marinoscillum sp. TaxID=2024838 RepID=UPI003BAB0340
MSDAKSKIRKGVLFNRRLLSDRVFEERNALLIKQSLNWCLEQKVKLAHCFLPITRNKEVNTWPLIEQLIQAKVEVVVSATDFKKQTMSHFMYSPELIFENDAFGIPTPTNGIVAEMSKVDMVIIPLLAADKSGNRVGYGKGYYDRLLTEMAPGLLKVGVTLGPLFDHFSFAEPHDISLDFVITPFETVKCK